MAPRVTQARGRPVSRRASSHPPRRRNAGGNLVFLGARALVDCRAGGRPRDAGNDARGTMNSRIETFLASVRASFSLALLLALLLYAVWPWLPLHAHAAVPQTIVFYGFSILDHAIVKDVFPAFGEAWRRRTGQSIELISSFAGSGTVTNEIIMGVPVDLTLLALEADAVRL